MRCSRANRSALCRLGLPALVALAGCRPAAKPIVDVPTAKTQHSVPAPGFPLTITDDAGRRVTLARSPARIVSLAPSNTEILYALGLGDRVVAIDELSNYPPEATRKPRIGGYAAPSLEQVLAAAPDLVLVTGLHLPDAVRRFEAQHLTTLVLAPKDLDAILHDIALVGQATGRSAQ